MTSQQEIDEALKELLPFLDVLTPEDYKGQILEHILGMTGTTDGILYLARNKKLIDSLIDLTQYDKSDKIKLDCLRILVNLSSTSHDLLQFLLDPDFLYFLLNVVIHNDLGSSDLAAMLLSNISQNSDHCVVIAKHVKEHDIVTLEKLVNAFCTQNYNKQCELHHLGSFLSNLTSVKDVTLQFLEGKFVERVMSFTQFKASSVRRLSVAAIIKNCLFETDYHERLCDAGILLHLLMPLAGPEEFTEEEYEEMPVDLQYLPSDKEREPDKEIQKLLIDSLFQLCATKICRMILKKSGVYYFLRELHKAIDEEDPIMFSLENLVQVLIGDEPGLEKCNYREIEIPENIQNKLNKCN